jgi:hypothetical protein
LGWPQVGDFGWPPGIETSSANWTTTTAFNGAVATLATFKGAAAPVAPSNFPFFGVGASLLAPSSPDRDPVSYEHTPVLAADFRQSGAIGAN